MRSGGTTFAEKNDLDWAYAMPGIARFRCSFFQQQQGMGGVFRLIPEEIKSVEELGVPKLTSRTSVT